MNHRVISRIIAEPLYSLSESERFIIRIERDEDGLN